MAQLTITYEDFDTDYTEQDGDSLLTVTDDTVTFASINRTTFDTHVREDQGAGALTDWVHTFEFKITVVTASAATQERVSLLTYTNAINGYWASKVIGDTQIAVIVHAHASDNALYNLVLSETYSGTEYTSELGNLTEGTAYYGRILKKDTTCVLYVYTDASLTTLSSSASLTLQADHAIRYIMAVQSYEGSTSKTSSGYIKNLLRESSSTEPRYIIKEILEEGTVTKDDGSTIADVLHVYEGGPQPLRDLIASFDAVVTHEEAREDSSRYHQDVPGYRTYRFPVTVHATDTYSSGSLVTTGTLILEKLRDNIHTLIEENAQPGTGYTLRFTEGVPTMRDVAGYAVWECTHIIEYKESS